MADDKMTNTEGTNGEDGGQDESQQAQGYGQDDDLGFAPSPDDRQQPAPPPPSPGSTLYAQTPEGHWIMQNPDGSRYHVYDDNGYLHGHAYDGDMPPGASEIEPPELFPGCRTLWRRAGISSRTLPGRLECLSRPLRRPPNSRRRCCLPRPPCRTLSVPAFS